MILIEQVIWAEQQTAKIRTKRDFIPRDATEVDGTTDDQQNLPVPLSHQDLFDVGTPLINSKHTKATQLADTSIFNDPMWPHQWYLV